LLECPLAAFPDLLVIWIESFNGYAGGSLFLSFRDVDHHSCRPLSASCRFHPSRGESSRYPLKTIDAAGLDFANDRPDVRRKSVCGPPVACHCHFASVRQSGLPSRTPRALAAARPCLVSARRSLLHPTWPWALPWHPTQSVMRLVSSSVPPLARGTR